MKEGIGELFAAFIISLAVATVIVVPTYSIVYTLMHLADHVGYLVGFIIALTGIIMVIIYCACS